MPSKQKQPVLLFYSVYQIRKKEIKTYSLRLAVITSAKFPALLRKINHKDLAADYQDQDHCSALRSSRAHLHSPASSMFHPWDLQH